MVFKGGTSLSKSYGLINRFSEDVDIAIIIGQKKSGNEIKTIICAVEKEITSGLKEKQIGEFRAKVQDFENPYSSLMILFFIIILFKKYFEPLYFAFCI